MVTLQKCEKNILNKQVSNEFASQMVIFSQWSDIQKGYSKTRDYSEKGDFSVVTPARLFIHIVYSYRARQIRASYAMKLDAY